MAKVNNAIRIVEFETEDDLRFIYNKEILHMEEAPDEISYFTIQEISLLNDLGMVTIDDTTYDIEEIEYVMDMYGVRYADIYLD